MGENKISILKYLRLNGPKTALGIAKNYCGEDRYGYMAWYNRLVDLHDNGYVRFNNDGRFPLCTVELAPSGEDALEHSKKLRVEKRVEWLRYIVTTIIAVSALILSAISIAAQLGWLQFPPA